MDGDVCPLSQCIRTVSLPPLTLFPPNPGSQWSFYFFHVFTVSRRSYSWNHSLAFSGWLLSLSDMDLRFLNLLSFHGFTALYSL